MPVVSQASLACRALIERWEGCCLTAYQDQKGVWTIGYGHTDGVHPGMVITQAAADAMLSADLEFFEQGVAGAVRTVITQNEFDALTSFTFNVGVGNLKRSNVLAHVNTGDYARAADCFLDWDEVAGQPNEGVLNRRKAERALFLGTAAVAAAAHAPLPKPAAVHYPDKVTAPTQGYRAAPDPTDGQADALDARFDVI